MGMSAEMIPVMETVRGTGCGWRTRNMAFLLVSVCLVVVFSNRQVYASSERALAGLQITPGLGVKGRYELGMNLSHICENGSLLGRGKTQFYRLSEMGVLLEAGDDGVVDAIIFQCATKENPDRDGPVAGHLHNPGGTAFPGGIVGLTHRIDTLKTSDVITAFGRLPMADNFFPWMADLVWLDVPVMESMRHGGDIPLRLHYPDVGLTFKRDVAEPERIQTVTVTRARSCPDESVVLHGKIPLSVLNTRDSTNDFGHIRGGGGKLHLFTLCNDIRESVHLNRVIPPSHCLKYDYGVTDLKPGDSTYLGLVIKDWAPEIIEIPVSCAMGGTEPKKLTVRLRRVLCGWSILPSDGGKD